MKSQKGFARLKLEITVIVLMFLAGITAYVVFQNNGIVDQIEENVVTQTQNQTEVITEEEN